MSMVAAVQELSGTDDRETDSRMSGQAGYFLLTVLDLLPQHKAKFGLN